jgi:branched-chain amino acid transport system permease protein
MFGYLLVSGLCTGALYALVASGLVLAHRVTNQINFAHGESFVLGGFVAFALHVTLGWPYGLALVGAALAGLAVGILTDRFVYRKVASSDAMTIVLAFVGVSFLVKGIVRWIWGGRGEVLGFPPVVESMPVEILGIPVIPQQIVVGAAALVCVAALMVFFLRTRAGLRMRAVAGNPTAAVLVGISIERHRMWAWAAAGMLAAVAGALAAPITFLSPDRGFSLLLRAFAAMSLGGMGSLSGSMVGGLLIGVIEAMAGGYIGSATAELAPFVTIIVVLAWRPEGIVAGRRLRTA